MPTDEEDLDDKKLRVIGQLVWDFLSPTKFHQAFGQLGRTVDVEGMLNYLASLSSSDMKHPSGTTPEDVLEAIYVQGGAKEAPTRIGAELLLMGATAYGKMGEYLKAEAGHDRERAIAVGKSVLSELDSSKCPRHCALVNAGVGSQICALSTDNSSQSADGAVPFLEAALSGAALDDAGQAKVHSNLVFIFSKPSWDDAERRQQKAIDHAERALGLARKANNYEIIFQTLKFLIDSYRDHAGRLGMEDKRSGASEFLLKAKAYCQSMIEYAALPGLNVEIEEDYHAAIASLDEAIEYLDDMP